MTISRRTISSRTATLVMLAAISSLAALALLPAAGDAAGLPRLATQEPPHELQVKPALVLYTGDGTGFVSGSDPTPSASGKGGIEWETWTTSSALGHGFNYVNNCRPDCADGTFHKYAATIKARSPKGGNFTRMTIEYKAGGKTVYDHRILEKGGGYYYWGICGEKFTGPC